MAILPGPRTSRYSILALQRALPREAGVTSKRLLSSRGLSLHPYVGAPEYPTPGTQAYNESMERLKNPRTLEVLSVKGPQHFRQSEVKIQEWMKVISNQNAELLKEVHRLTHKVEQLENKVVGLGSS